MDGKEGGRMKKIWKAGVAGAIAFSALASTVSPAAANTAATALQNEFQEAAAEVMPMFMFARVETISSWEFDVIVTYDTTSTTTTSSGWRIVGLQDVEIKSKVLTVVSYKYSYEYYDNYQGLNIDIEYVVNSAGLTFVGNKTVKVHV